MTRLRTSPSGPSVDISVVDASRLFAIADSETEVIERFLVSLSGIENVRYRRAANGDETIINVSSDGTDVVGMRVTVNRDTGQIVLRGGMPTVPISGGVYDSTTSATAALEAILTLLRVANTSTQVCVELEAPGGQTYYFDGVNTIGPGADNVVLRQGNCADLLFGAGWRFKVSGSPARVPETNRPNLGANAPSGQTFIIIGTTIEFDRLSLQVGNFLQIFGERDAQGDYGDNFFEATVTALNRPLRRIDLSAPLDQSFAVTYPNGSQTEVAKVISARMTSNVARTARVIPVDDTSFFSIGDLVQLVDDESSGNFYQKGTAGAVNREKAIIVEVDTAGSSIRLDHACYHDYATAQTARVIKYVGPDNVAIIGIRGRWLAQGTNNALEARDVQRASIVNCRLYGGAAGGWNTSAFTLRDCYKSKIVNCEAYNPPITSSGRGYGAALYGATDCDVIDCDFTGCRHSIILSNGASGSLIDNCRSRDCKATDYDLHGLNTRASTFRGCKAVGGNSQPNDQPAGQKSAYKVGNPTWVKGDYDIIFDGCEAWGYGDSVSQGSMFEFLPSSRGIRVINCIAYQCWRVLRCRPNTKTFSTDAQGNPIAPAQPYLNLICDDVLFDGGSWVAPVNELLDCDGGSGDSYQKFTFQNITIENASDGLVFLSMPGLIVRRLEFKNVSLIPPDTYAININDCLNAQISNNVFRGMPRGLKATASPGFCFKHNDTSNMLDGIIVDDNGAANASAAIQNNDESGIVLPGVKNALGTPYITSGGLGRSPLQVIERIGKTYWYVKAGAGNDQEGNAVPALALPYAGTVAFAHSASAPAVGDGNLVLTYVGWFPPGNTILVTAQFLEVQTTVADLVQVSIMKQDSGSGVVSYIGGGVQRVSSGGTSGCFVKGIGSFIATGDKQTITLRIGAIVAAQLLIPNVYGAQFNQPSISFEVVA